MARTERTIRDTADTRNRTPMTIHALGMKKWKGWGKVRLGRGTSQERLRVEKA